MYIIAYTECPRSLDTFYIVTYYMKCVKTSSTDRDSRGLVRKNKHTAAVSIAYPVPVRDFLFGHVLDRHLPPVRDSYTGVDPSETAFITVHDIELIPKFGN